MDTTALVNLLTLLMAASLFAQRVTEGIKSITGFSKLEPYMQMGWIHVMTFVASFCAVLMLTPAKYELLPGSGHYQSVAALTMLASLGSSFWHDVLTIVSQYAKGK